MKQITRPYHLKVFKKGAGAPVVVLHGQVSTHRYMRDVTNLLAPDRTVYAFDLLGFGRSPRPRKAAYSIDQHLDSIHHTLQQQGMKLPFVLVGHSMGAQLALAYSVKYPDKVSGLVITGLPLFDSKDTALKQLAALSPSHSWLLQGKRTRVLGFMPAVVKPVIASLASLFSKREFPVRVIIDVVRNNWQSFSRSLQHVVIEYEPYPDVLASQHEIYFIFGDKDTIAVHPKQKLEKFTHKKHHVKVVSGTHHVPLEHPKVIADTVLSL